MRRYVKELCILCIFFLLTVGFHVVRINEREGDELYSLFKKLSLGMQFKQAGICIFLFVLGMIMLYSLNMVLGNAQSVLLAYPLGVAIWISASCIILYSGCYYSFWTVLGLIIVLVVGLLARKKRKLPKQDFCREPLIRYSIVSLGFLGFLTTGAYFIFSSFDTYYFIELLGKALVIEGGITANFKTFLLHTNVGVATLNALAYMFGVDNIYVIHQFLMINLVIFFAYVIYTGESRACQKRAGVFAGLVTTFLFLLPPIQLLMGWIISNTYVLVYLFIIVILMDNVYAIKDIPKEMGLILSILIITLSLLRTESSILICSLAICLITANIGNKYILMYILMPGALITAGIYICYFILLEGNIDGMHINKETMAAILALYGALILYYAVFRGRRLLIIQKHFGRFYFGGMLLICILFLIFRFDSVVACLSVYLFNSTDVTISGGIWGVTGVMLFVLSGVSYVVNKREITFVEYTVIILYFAAAALGVLRGDLYALPRKGFGDSFNRTFISYLPLAVYALWNRIHFRNDKK